MKFCKKYQEYMKGQEKKQLPGVGIKNLKKILKKCRGDFHYRREFNEVVDFHNNCPRQCPVCDGTFFPALMKEMSAVVGFFNKRAQKLLDLHLASGFRKYIIWLIGKGQRKHLDLIQEGIELVTYALINAAAIRKILKKYDKIHYSRQGQAFKTRIQKMRIEILQSPWLCELMAFHINLKETQKYSEPRVSEPSVPELFQGCSLTFNDGKPSISCNLFDSVKVDIELTCSICLETVFDPVSLSCGHIFCYMCACSAASVSIVDGLKAAEPKEKCPLCRQICVFKDAVHLDELSILLKQSCSDYWEQRHRAERAERLRQVKEHWDGHSRAFAGI